MVATPVAAKNVWSSHRISQNMMGTREMKPTQIGYQIVHLLMWFILIWNQIVQTHPCIISIRPTKKSKKYQMAPSNEPPNSPSCSLKYVARVTFGARYSNRMTNKVFFTRGVSTNQHPTLFYSTRIRHTASKFNIAIDNGLQFHYRCVIFYTWWLS